MKNWVVVSVLVEGKFRWFSFIVVVVLVMVVFFDVVVGGGFMLCCLRILEYECGFVFYNLYWMYGCVGC